MKEAISAINNTVSNTHVQYRIFFARLAIIILIAELLVMGLLGEFGLNLSLPNPWRAIVDDGLLLLLSAFPIYAWVYLPIVHGFQKKQREVEMLAEALRGAGDSAVITDPAGNILYVNDAFTKVTGYESSEVLGKNPRVLSSGVQSRTFYERMWKAITNEGKWKGELLNKRKDGRLYPEYLDIRAIKSSNGATKFYVGLFSDLTEKKEIEKALLQSQKLEAVGTLVGGVAHNFNNLLAAIAGKAYLGGNSKDQEKSKAYFKDIEKLSYDSAQLIRQLLTFARETEHETQHIPLLTMLKEAIKTVQIGIPENITLKTSLEETDAIVTGDAVHLAQVFINIINNARDAVSQSKVKEISITMNVLDRSQCRHASQCSKKCGRFFKTDISDTGTGMSDTTISKVFDPFFTTKEPGKGTGLGLSTALGAIKEAGGFIDLESLEGKGTTFSVYLPIDESHLQTTEATLKIEHANHDHMILVVDDDQHVRETTANILEELGYKTLHAIDGMNALEVYESKKDKIDLVMTDMVMPRLDGHDLMLKIRETSPQLPVILMTGYDSPANRTKEILSNNNTILLHKPVTIELLSSKLKSLLE